MIIVEISKRTWFFHGFRLYKWINENLEKGHEVKWLKGSNSKDSDWTRGFLFENEDQALLFVINYSDVVVGYKNTSE